MRVPSRTRRGFSTRVALAHASLADSDLRNHNREEVAVRTTSSWVAAVLVLTIVAGSLAPVGSASGWGGGGTGGGSSGGGGGGTGAGNGGTGAGTGGGAAGGNPGGSGTGGGREARAMGVRVAVRGPTADSARVWGPGATPGIRGT